MSSSSSSSSNTGVSDFFGVGWEPEESTTTYDDYNNNNNTNNTIDITESTIPPEVINPLTDTQEKVLSVLFVFSGLLSIIGSTTIVVKVLRNLCQSKSNSKSNSYSKSKTTTTTTTTPYDRIMLGLSSTDIVASLSWVLTPFLMPSDDSPNSRVWAIGNDASCTFLGTISQFGFCAVIYNLILSMYYLLTVKYNMKRKIFSQRYEPWIHVVPITYFAITAIVGGIVGVYSEVDLGLGCWVNDFPDGCELEPETCTSARIGWAYGAGPTILTFIVLIVNNILIYYHVKNKLGVSDTTGGDGSKNKNKKFKTIKQESSSTTTITDHTSSNNINFVVEGDDTNNITKVSATTSHTTTNTSSSSPLTPSSAANTTTGNTNNNIESLLTTATNIEDGEDDDTTDNMIYGVSSSSSQDIIPTTTDENENENDESTRRLMKHQRYIREVATQGFLYVGTFFVAYTPAFALRAIEVYGTYPLQEQPMFPLFVLVSISLPLQGFFNMFVYNRPNFTRVRQAFPDRSILWAIKTACLDSNIPRLSTDLAGVTGGGRTGTAAAAGGGGGGTGGGGGSASNNNKRIPNNNNNNNRSKRSHKNGSTGGSGSGGGVGGGGIVVASHNNNYRVANYYSNRTSSSGKNFSSGLQVVREGSQEEDYDDLMSMSMSMSMSSSSSSNDDNEEVCDTDDDHNDSKEEKKYHSDMVHEEMKSMLDNTGITAKMVDFEDDDEDGDDDEDIVVENSSSRDHEEGEKSSSIPEVSNDDNEDNVCDDDRQTAKNNETTRRADGDSYDYDEENQQEGSPQKSMQVLSTSTVDLATAFTSPRRCSIDSERSITAETIRRSGSVGKMISFDGSILDTFSTATIDA